MPMEKILFCGDLFYDYDFISEDIESISDWIASNNVATILNLESPIGKGKGKAIKKRGPNLSSNKKVIDVLKKLNVIGVCLANNHMMDYGSEALLDTIDILRDNGISHVGAGVNLRNALKPMVLNVCGKSIAVLNFGWDIEETVYAGETTGGCAPRNEKVIISSVKNAKKAYDDVIVCMHWGFEYNRLPMPYDIQLAHQIIDSGADLIVGHHPHCVQPKEVYNGKTIYYSLGNFYFASRRKNYKRRFDETISNQSDYGCVITYDAMSEECKEYLIYYDHMLDSSVLKNIEKLILEDISDIDFNSKEYIELVNRRKLNINPILSCDERQNKKAINRLFARYKIKSIIKMLLKRL